MRTHIGTFRSETGALGVCIAVLTVMALVGCGPRTAVASPTEGGATKNATTNGERPGVRFPRADLVDIATYVSERTGKGFVLATPELRTVPISLFHPADVSAEKLEEMFLLALDAGGLAAVPHDGFLLIHSLHPASGRPDRGGAHGGAHKDDAGQVHMDFRNAPIESITGFVSGALGRKVVVGSRASHTRLTIQAHSPMSADEAYALIVLALETEGLTASDKDGVLVINRAGSAHDRAQEKPLAR